MVLFWIVLFRTLLILMVLSVMFVALIVLFWIRLLLMIEYRTVELAMLEFMMVEEFGLVKRMVLLTIVLLKISVRLNALKVAFVPKSVLLSIVELYTFDEMIEALLSRDCCKEDRLTKVRVRLL